MADARSAHKPGHPTSLTGVSDLSQGPRDTAQDCSVSPTRVSQAHSEEVHQVMVMRLSLKYIQSAPAILKLIQAMFVLVALTFLTTAEPEYAGYLLLPLDWHLRLFVFVTVFCLIFSLVSFVVHAYRLTETLRIDWNKFDFLLYCMLCFGLLFASSMVASAIGYYEKLAVKKLSPTCRKHLVIGTVFGYVGMFLYGASAYYAGRQWRALMKQFSPYRFPSQGSTSQPHTPSTDTTAAPNIIV